MKRLHVSINVSNLDNSIQFYSDLFGAEPTVIKTDYAKWMLDDPRVNFVIERSDDTTGLTHAGIQVESDGELNEMFNRMKAAEMPYLEEGMTTCCYHKSEKSWTLDPDGLPWEAFYTHHATEERGTSEMVPPACCAAEPAATPAPDCC
jgi:catechol 2,3-dioxygenase-like lactoylglutathione lyase family enzyme